MTWRSFFEQYILDSWHLTEYRYYLFIVLLCITGIIAYDIHYCMQILEPSNSEMWLLNLLSLVNVHQQNSATWNRCPVRLWFVNSRTSNTVCLHPQSAVFRTFYSLTLNSQLWPFYPKILYIHLCYKKGEYNTFQVIMLKALKCALSSIFSPSWPQNLSSID